MSRFLSILVLTIGAVPPAVAQQALPESPPAASRAEVLVLGVYHMANPGHDIFNAQVDDVLSPKRQAEMAQMMEVLKRFHPTKIAIEATVGDKERPKGYADYVAGKHDLTRNEIEQIGFRLAKELGHETVYPADVDGEFPYQRVVNYAKANDRSKTLDGMMAEVGDRVKALNAYLASHTVLETLLSVNSDASVAQEVGFYYRQAKLGDPGDWAGADLVADWFRRNIRIYSNVLQLADSPGERVLVIFGYGHLGWLQHSVASNPDLRLRKLSEFVR